MSTSKKKNNLEESANGNNAYYTVSSEDLNKTITKTKSDDSHYLTAKPGFRARSDSLCSIPTSDSLTIPLPVNTLASSTTSSASGSFSSLNQVLTSGDSSQKPKVQIGMDRYITVTKRKRSPKSSKISSSSKISRDDHAVSISSQNRFSALQDKNDESVISPSKPPLIYLREKNSNSLIKKLVSAIGEKSFHVMPLKRGNIDETKIQIYSENNYRKIIADFEKNKMVYYTYQLKSAKGMQIVLKGIDSSVDPEEVKIALIENEFKVKNVANIRNRERVPQPMFRVELEPNDVKLKKNECHPVYNLKFLLHRKITVEEPHKRSGPVQCHNCQEYGHTKTYCKLPSVCVVCGELHGTNKCNKPKDDQKHKKCSNCGGNHTANYRGCPVFSFVKQSLNKQPKPTVAETRKIFAEPNPQIAKPNANHVSYADALKSNNFSTQKVSMPNTLPNTSSSLNFSRFEATLDTLVQTINRFTINMTSMMQEMLRMQNTLLQAIVNRP